MFGNRKRSPFVMMNLFQHPGVFFMTLFLFVSIASGTHATLKDSDTDGITDDAESATYGTDPWNRDTDKDGFDDGYEVVNGADPQDAKSIPFVGQDGDLSQDKETSWSADWKIIGIVAGVLLVAFFFMTSRPKMTTPSAPEA